MLEIGVIIAINTVLAVRESILFKTAGTTMSMRHATKNSIVIVKITDATIAEMVITAIRLTATVMGVINNH
jgi:hypothetical protein